MLAEEGRQCPCTGAAEMRADDFLEVALGAKP